MLSRNLKIFLIFLVLLAIQTWCLAITYKYPFVGIELNLNKQKQWHISNINGGRAIEKSNAQIGDRILLADGKAPESVLTVYKWRKIEQAHTLTIERNGVIQEVIIGNNNSIFYDVLPTCEAMLCLGIGLFLMIKMNVSRSARILSWFFIAGGTIWISMGASIRGDGIGKIVIIGLMQAFPIIFYHFLVVFFKEKGNLTLMPKRFLKYGYMIVVFVGGLNLIEYAKIVQSVYVQRADEIFQEIQALLPWKDELKRITYSQFL